jgi:hypothetical protein
MPVESNITDPQTGKSARIVAGGALAIAPPHASLSFNATLGVDDTAVNIVPAKGDHVFCLTGILLTANQNVSNTTSATIQVYTASASDTAVADASKILFTVPLGRNDTRDITGILLETDVGQYINAETTDDDIFITVLGYYIKML